ncbi:hypothetical protein HD806DRAFT_532678 [Xylariaceae sp. AK1471]|nr:hypothetical protein HD806DRAFT_532678 [Xylariaceae sp. AK1471]
MTRKSGKRPHAPNGRIWDETDKVHLYAWLDYCIQHGIDFNSTIINHLKIESSKEFSLNQVNNKFEREWNRLGRFGTSKNDIYLEGTSCLDGLDPELGSAITQAINKYGEPSLRFRLRGTSAALKSRSQTLSITRQSSRSSSLSTLSTIATLELEQESHETSSNDGQGGSGKGISDETEILRDASRSLRPTLLQVEAYEQRMPSRGDELSDFKEESNAEVEYTPVNLPSGSGARNTSPRLELLQQELTETKRNLHATKSRFNELQNEIFTLNNRLLSARRENKELRYPIYATIANQNQTEMLAAQQHEISVLTAQIAATQEYRDGVDKIESGSLGPGDDDIRNECILIEDHMANACSWLSLQNRLLEKPRVVSSTDPLGTTVSNWARRIVGSGTETLIRCLLELNISTFELLRPIVAVGVCALVFETPFPELMTASIPILDHYRKQISARDGLKALEQLDLLAYHSLISEDYYISHIVVEKGKTLSKHLHQIIAPFLTTPEQHSQLGATLDSNSELDQIEADLNPTTLFEETFQRALRLKTNLFLSGGRFRWVFYQPGHIFDSEAMNRHGRDFNGFASARKDKRKSRRDSDGPRSNEPIKICVFPALYREISASGTVEFESRVVFEGSLTPTGVDDLRDLYLIAKAVVV